MSPPSDRPADATGQNPDANTAPNEPFDPLYILRTLARRSIKFIVIGGVAARAHGSPSVTVDLDICYERSARNLGALAEVLQELHASLRGADAGLPFKIERRTLELGDHFTLSTDAGPLDCLATPSGTAGFADLEPHAITLEVAGIPVKFASLEDLIRMKRAAGRPKDRIEIEVLEALREELLGSGEGPNR